jgi:hypothetical protein
MSGLILSLLNIDRGQFYKSCFVCNSGMFTCNSDALRLPELWSDLNNELQKEVSQLIHWSSVCAVVAPSTRLDLNLLTVLIRLKYGSKRKRLDFINFPIPRELQSTRMQINHGQNTVAKSVRSLRLLPYFDQIKTTSNYGSITARIKNYDLLRLLPYFDRIKTVKTTSTGHGCHTCNICHICIKYHCHVSLVTKCVTGDFLQMTFNDVGRRREGEGVSKDAF